MREGGGPNLAVNEASLKVTSSRFSLVRPSCLGESMVASSETSWLVA